MPKPRQEPTNDQAYRRSRGDSGRRHAAARWLPRAEPAEPPETVMVTYHAKQGSEDELARALADHWSTAKRLDLVAAEPHEQARRIPGRTSGY